MARKRKQAEHANHERWLVSYADFITLLFAFFVVMFAASNSDQKKAGQIAQAVQVAFKEMAVFAPSGKVVPLYDNGGLPTDTKSVIGNDHAGFEAAQLVTSSKTAANGKGSTISAVKAELEGLLKDEIAKHNI